MKYDWPSVPDTDQKFTDVQTAGSLDVKAKVSLNPRRANGTIVDLVSENVRETWKKDTP